MSLDLTIARTEALFASTLSACEPHDAAELRAGIAAAVRDYHGVRGCAAEMAQAFGDHPAQALQRMRWARDAARPLGRRAVPVCPIHGDVRLESCGLCRSAVARA